MQTQKANLVQITTLTVILLFGLYILFTPSPPTAEEIGGAIVIPSVVIPNISVPTAAEIAEQVNVPRLNNDNLDDVLEGVFPDLVDDIVDQCADDLWNEFGDNVDDDVEELIEEFLCEEVKDLRIVDYNWDDDFDFTIINLGLDNDEDRAVEFTSTLRVRYHEEFGDDDWHYIQVDTVSLCEDYDDNDNEFDDLWVEYDVI